MSDFWTGRCRPKARPATFFGNRPVLLISEIKDRGLALRPSPTHRLVTEP